MQIPQARANPTTAYRDRVLGALLPGVAHECANPLGFVRANLESLRRYAVRLGSFFAELHFRVRREAVPAQDLAALLERHRIPTILEDLPAVAEQCLEGLGQNLRLLEALRVFLCPDPEPTTPLDPAALVASARAVAWNRLKRRLRVEERLPALPPVTGRRSELTFALLALFLNAARAAREGGRLVVLGEAKERGTVRLYFVDDGPGVPPADRERIFAPGYSAWPDGPGAGLGLTVAREAARSHGGDLVCRETPGGGATFVLTLPTEGTSP